MVDGPIGGRKGTRPVGWTSGKPVLGETSPSKPCGPTCN